MQNLKDAELDRLRTVFETHRALGDLDRRTNKEIIAHFNDANGSAYTDATASYWRRKWRYTPFKRGKSKLSKVAPTTDDLVKAVPPSLEDVHTRLEALNEAIRASGVQLAGAEVEGGLVQLLITTKLA